jgi:hypothetical protein
VGIECASYTSNQTTGSKGTYFHNREINTNALGCDFVFTYRPKYRSRSGPIHPPDSCHYNNSPKPNKRSQTARGPTIFWKIPDHSETFSTNRAY